MTFETLPAVRVSSVAQARSGSNPHPEKGQPSASNSPSEEEQGRRKRLILIVEDNKADLFLIREAIAGIDADIHILMDGEQTIEFLVRVETDPNAPCPDLVLLDLNLPKRKGSDIVRAIRAGVRSRNARVLVVTSSDAERDREEMDRLGSNGYFRKPSEYAEFMKLGSIASRLFDEAGS